MCFFVVELGMVRVLKTCGPSTDNSHLSLLQAYFRKLGVTNAEVFEERFLDAAAHDSSLLDNVVAVLATPPNSYSAVTDPVDLVCSRGGDLAMLHQLTEPTGPGGLWGSGKAGAAAAAPVEAADGQDRQGQAGRGNAMLQEQAATLRLAMAKPQVPRADPANMPVCVLTSVPTRVYLHPARH